MAMYQITREYHPIQHAITPPFSYGFPMYSWYFVGEHPNPTGTRHGFSIAPLAPWTARQLHLWHVGRLT